jgi:hypothetical protein
MLSPDQLESFETQGFVRVPGAFSRDHAAAMADRVWSVLGTKFGVDRENPASWQLPIALGLQQVKKEAVFQAIGSPATLDALADVMRRTAFDVPENWGQLLVSFPQPGEPPPGESRADCHHC